MNTDVFVYGSTIQKTAYINWPFMTNSVAGHFAALAYNYSQAAQLLIASALDNNIDKKADSVILPALFNFNHSIELHLKSIIALGEELLGRGNRKHGTHDLKKLQDKAKGILIELGCDEKGLSEQLRPLTDYLDDLYQIIETNDKAPMDFARYPTSLKHEKYFYTDSLVNCPVNLIALKRTVVELDSALESLYLMLDAVCEGQCSKGRF